MMDGKMEVKHCISLSYGDDGLGLGLVAELVFVGPFPVVPVPVSVFTPVSPSPADSLGL